MKEFTDEQELTLIQAAHIARAMWKVAESEHGVHAREQEMIEAFYRSCSEATHAPDLDFAGQPWNGAQARSVLSTTALQDILLRSCYLLGYADGQCSALEEASIDEIARDLGIDDAHRQSVNQEVKKLLLSQFEGIQIFREATYDIGRQLGLDRDEVKAMLD